MSNEEYLQKRIVQRFAAADFVLSELEKGRFPYLSRFLTNARFNLRQITDREPFEERGEQPAIEKLLAASKSCGTIHVSMEPMPRISLFYDKVLTEAEATLFATSLQKVAALAFAALGLDMSGLATVEDAMPHSGTASDNS
jgi:hypothetical protein